MSPVARIGIGRVVGPEHDGITNLGMVEGAEFEGVVGQAVLNEAVAPCSEAC